VWAPRAAEVVVIATALGFIAAFFTGWTDWSDTYGAERSTGLWHGLLNSTALVLYIVSALVRLGTSDGQSVAAAVLSFLGFGTVSVAAYLGGHLVFKYGTNVNHTAWEHGADDYESVGPLEQIADNALSRVVVDGVPVVLLRQGEKLAALAATCTHAGGPLDEGELLPGNVVKCPWHGSRFRMGTGQVVDGPATMAEPRYLVRIREGQVELKRA
jgi:nitrite reductase/ring-hydroxylating ferredoxin subunit